MSSVPLFQNAEEADNWYRARQHKSGVVAKVYREAIEKREQEIAELKLALEAEEQSSSPNSQISAENITGLESHKA